MGDQYDLLLGEKSGKMPAGQLNVEQMFEVWSYKPPKSAVAKMYGMLYVPGSTPVAPPPQGAATSATAAPASPPAAPSVDKDTKPVDWDAKDKRNARMNGINNATALVVAIAEYQQTQPDIENIKAAAEQIVDYIYNGNHPF